MSLYSFSSVTFLKFRNILKSFSVSASIIFFPYILGKACKKDNDTIKVNLLDKPDINNRITNASEIKNVKNYDMNSKYCMPSISISCLKEFGRTDPTGASLFLHPRIPIFWRIFIPLAITGTFALFISSNSGTSATVNIILGLERRIQIPSFFNFGLINNVRTMWEGEAYPLAVILGLFSGIWPYIKLILIEKQQQFSHLHFLMRRYENQHKHTKIYAKILFKKIFL